MKCGKNKNNNILTRYLIVNLRKNQIKSSNKKITWIVIFLLLALIINIIYRSIRYKKRCAEFSPSFGIYK